MPLIEKGILIEGPNGETMVRKYYVREQEENPYSRIKKRRSEKIGEILRRPTVENKATLSKDGRVFNWSMGYNHCVGYYSPGGQYCPFSGSSLNRDKNLKHGICKKALPENPKDIPVGDGNLLVLAYQVAKWYHKRSATLPAPLSNFIVRQDPETEREFRMWFPDTFDRPANGISLPIYQLSPRSRGKIKDKATAFFRACPGERVFCTLTFLAPVDDGTGIALLNKYLTSLRKEFAKLQYLWVAERQENGNIHFHIILNRRISIRRYNALWVMQQYNAGLRGKTLFGVPISMQEIEARYKAGTIHKVFNPVDIKRVRSIAGLSAYLTKYITKQGRNPDGSKKEVYFACSPWHCSRGVSKLFTKAVVGPSAFAYMMSLENCKLDKSTGEVFLPKMVRPSGVGRAFCVIIYVNKKDAPLKYLREMEVINKWLIKGMEVKEGYIDTLTNEIYRKQFCKN